MRCKHARQMRKGLVAAGIQGAYHPGTRHGCQSPGNADSFNLLALTYSKHPHGLKLGQLCLPSGFQVPCKASVQLYVGTHAGSDDEHCLALVTNLCYRELCWYK